MKIVSRKDAIKQGLKRYFTGKPCKHGHVSVRWTKNRQCLICSRSYSRQYYNDNDEQQRRNNRLWKRNNPEKHAAYNRAWAKANVDSVNATKRRRLERDPDRFYAQARERSRLFYQRHPTLVNANAAAHRAQRLKRHCEWADKEALRFFYECRPAGCHVDHIVPLQGDLISGLHVETNLQWLPAIENVRKGNSFNVAKAA